MKKPAIVVFTLFILSLIPASYSRVLPIITIGDNESMCKGRAGMRNWGDSYDQVIYDKCIEELEKAKQEEYLNSPEYQQKLLEEKQAELEKKQAELEAKQKALEEKAEAVVEKVVEKVIEKTEKKMDLLEAKAYSSLGKEASIVEAIADEVKKRDEVIQKKISLILETFKLSDDEYTRNIGVYLSYLLR